MTMFDAGISFDDVAGFDGALVLNAQSINSVVITGTDLALTPAVATGDAFPCGDRAFLLVRNGSGASVTVTINDPRSAKPTGAAAFDPDVSVTIPAGQTRVIGPLDFDRFANAAGLADVSYSAVTSVSVGAFTL